MKSIRTSMALIAITLTAFYSCSKTDFSKPQSESLPSQTVRHDGSVCGEPVVYCLIDKNKVVQGTLSISNDETNIFITFNITSTKFKMQKAELVIGDLAHITAATSVTAWPKLAQGPNPPDFKKTFKPEVTTYTFTIPAADYQDCFLVNAFAKLVQRDAYNNIVKTDYVFLKSTTKTTSNCWTTYVEYCKQDCPPPPQCGQLTTYTQGGYGNDLGNGTGTQYLIDHFATAFPNGVTIGCSTGFTLTMNSASAIQAYLPSSTTPTALTQNWVDDGPDNVLAGQILTLALSIGFDNTDDNFGAAGIHLEEMIIGGNNPFTGMTVAQFFDIANGILGGCRSDYSFDDVEQTVDAINKNYDGGTVDNGFLVCPNSQ